jgi:DHA1 family bicyclomycin/chloramphenicol resistance-like MFS transporter
MDWKLFRHALVLGLITAGGSLGIDMYLPAFPAITRDLHANAGAVQMSLAIYLLALGVGQVFYGPLSDALGRRAPLLAGLLVYTLSSIACAFVHNVDQLIVCRAFQGLGACAGQVIVRAIVRDMYTGPEAVKLLALIMMVVGVSPIASPVVGGVLTQLFSWSVIFWAQGAAGALALTLSLFALRETRPPEERTAGGVIPTIKLYGSLLLDRRYMGLILVPGLNQGGTFSFVSGSSFLFIRLLGATPAAYSLIFACCAVGLIGGAQFTSMAVRRFGSERVILCAMVVNVMGGLLLLGATASGLLSIPVAFAAFLMVFSSIGFIGAPASVLALEPYRAHSGQAAALMGALQAGWGAIGGIAVSTFFNGTAWPIALSLSGFGLSALILATAILGPRLRALGAATPRLET